MFKHKPEAAIQSTGPGQVNANSELENEKYPYY